MLLYFKANLNNLNAFSCVCVCVAGIFFGYYSKYFVYYESTIFLSIGYEKMHTASLSMLKNIHHLATYILYLDLKGKKIRNNVRGRQSYI